MTKRARLATFGSAAALVVAGAVCEPVIGGGVGGVLALVLIGAGLVAATSLVFLEVGLSEDHARAQERKVARRGAGRRRGGSSPGLERSRSHPRRLR